MFKILKNLKRINSFCRNLNKINTFLRINGDLTDDILKLDFNTVLTYFKWQKIRWALILTIQNFNNNKIQVKGNLWNNSLGQHINIEFSFRFIATQIKNVLIRMSEYCDIFHKKFNIPQRPRNLALYFIIYFADPLT